MKYIVVTIEWMSAHGLTPLPTMRKTKDGSKFAVTLSETEKTLKRKESFTLTAEISPKAELPILWKSSNPEIAEVQDGKVTAKKDGTAVISAYVAGERYDCTVTVGEPEQAE